MENQEKTTQEEFKVNGKDLVDKVKEVIKAGNVRRVIVKNREGKTVIELPLTYGVVGALLLPSLAAVGAVAALLTECTLVVVKTEETK